MHAAGYLEIFLAALAAGVLATIAAGASLALPATLVPRLVSFAVGALLGAVFVELLPDALERGHPEGVMVTVLAGLLVFFLLEKLVLWRHSHGEAPHDDARDETEHAHAMHAAHARGHDHGRSGLMILIGNSVHNVCDGIVIAAAFIADARLGLVTTLAIVAHAVPQQIGDFAVLLHSGYTRARAFAVNVATGLATLAGATAGYFALAALTGILPTVLAIASASLLYVAVADLIPSLHRRPEPLETLKQMLLILSGIAIIAFVHLALEP
jgi:zinc and cadmium transporter